MIRGKSGMERDKAIIRKRETGMIVMDSRIEQNLGMWPKVCKGGVVKQVVVEHLDHNIGAGEIGQPIAEDILRQKPSANPTALEIETQRFADCRLRKRPGLLAESIIYGRECATGDT